MEGPQSFMEEKAGQESQELTSEGRTEVKFRRASGNEVSLFISFHLVIYESAVVCSLAIWYLLSAYINAVAFQ